MLEGSRTVSREKAEDERRLAANERQLKRGRLRQETRWWGSKAGDALEDYQHDLPTLKINGEISVLV